MRKIGRAIISAQSKGNPWYKYDQMVCIVNWEKDKNGRVTIYFTEGDLHSMIIDPLYLFDLTNY